MSIKDDVNYVKKELGADEQILESVLKLETFYKRHKYKIWAVVAAVVLFFSGRAILSTIHESKLERSNVALSMLQADPANSEALEILRGNNPELYELYIYSGAVKAKDIKQLEELTKSKNPLIADMSGYAKQVLASKSSDSIYYKEMSLIEDAYLDLKSGKNRDAKSKLELIDARSSVAPVADLLKHYSIKGE